VKKGARNYPWNKKWQCPSCKITQTWSGTDEETFPNEGEDENDSPCLATFPNAGENPTIPEIGEDTIILEIGENPIIPARGEEQQMDHEPKIIKEGSYLYADGPSFISQIFSTKSRALGYYHLLHNGYHHILLTGSTLVSRHR
jgi:hypothetical protein